MLTNAEIVFYDEDDNPKVLALTNPQIYAIKRILGLNYNYSTKCFSCYDDESVTSLTKTLFGKLELKD